MEKNENRPKAKNKKCLESTDFKPEGECFPFLFPFILKLEKKFEEGDREKQKLFEEIKKEKNECNLKVFHADKVREGIINKNINRILDIERKKNNALVENLGSFFRVLDDKWFKFLESIKKQFLHSFLQVIKINSSSGEKEFQVGEILTAYIDENLNKWEEEFFSILSDIRRELLGEVSFFQKNLGELTSDVEGVKNQIVNEIVRIDQEKETIREESGKKIKISHGKAREIDNKFIGFGKKIVSSGGETFRTCLFHSFERFLNKARLWEKKNTFNGRRGFQLEDVFPYGHENPVRVGNVVFIPQKFLFGKKVFVVGDLHGDFQSLEKVFSKTGFFESENVVLIFLGDYIDRGWGSLSVLFRLLDCKNNFWERVFLLRGNHEEFKIENGLLKNSTLSNYKFVDSVNFFLSGISHQGNDFIGVVKEFSENLPDFLIFEDGCLVMHGFVLPNMEDPEKGEPTPEQRRKYEVFGIECLWDKIYSGKTRWQRFEKKEKICFVWPNAFFQSDFLDWEKFCEVTGLKSIIRGHDHVKTGFIDYSGSGEILEVCTSRSVCDSPSFIQIYPEFNVLKVLK